MTWQPISSAPRDGTHVLIRYLWAHREKWVAQGWYAGDGWSTRGHPRVRATHWTPLPEPPALEARTSPTGQITP